MQTNIDPPIKMNQISANQDQPILSIVIVNFNGFTYLKKSVSSLLRSTYSSYQIIIVDNASSDESVLRFQKEFGEDLKKIQILSLTRNYGFSIANNIGAKKAKGKYILFLNNDTEIEPSCLDRLVTLMESDALIGVAQPKIRLVNRRDTLDCAGAFFNPIGYSYVRGEFEEDHGQYNLLDEISYAKGAAMIVRKTVWTDLGGFDPLFFVYFEETDFCWRVWLSGYKVVFVPSALVFHVGGATTSLVNNTFEFQSFRNRIAMVVKNLSIGNLIKYTPFLVLRYFLDTTFRLRKNGPLSMLHMFEGVAWCLRYSRLLWTKRLTTQRQRVISDDTLFRRGVISQKIYF
jgi:GT2 family glycosyltransferase